MQVRPRVKVGKPTTNFEKDLEKELSSYSREVANALNKGIRYTDNFNAEVKTVADSGAINTEFAVAHTLKRVPLGFHVLKINKAGIVFDSGTTWTDTNVYLKCSVANCAITLLVF
jgi:hypothetical protein